MAYNYPIILDVKSIAKWFALSQKSPFHILILMNYLDVIPSSLIGIAVGSRKQ